MNLPLTDIQRKVHELDQNRIRPSKIASTLGLSLARVANVKGRLRELGCPVTVWHVRDGSSLRPAKAKLVREFCKCGLTLPCNSCLPGQISAFSNPGEDTILHIPGGQVHG